ncbi:hypothetical protein [Flavisolibacter ginsenosidimutans]|uniref:Uncharacterized protein n=1 Tax=Flavisolibacter ginsenosidimutans TaxID=661481 RepID=A0A5B8UEJ2_9BACT|nr:hypothetical protein [Flavisolibacter ginsenosidimutans]QEC54539.1 hypothetical protein FSB75_01020 [Flavisolibacter ginsenosidimutans]
MENVANVDVQKRTDETYKDIPGWGIDADPENEPTYPMKHYTGDDHQRLHYERPPLQPVDVEVLHSNERPNVTAAFGTVSPPSGLSGMLRRYAFQHSEGSSLHWLPLIMADRINAIEGIVDDLAHGHIPNVFAERGWNAEWKYNRKGLITKIAVTTLVATTVIALLSTKKKKKKRFSF